MLVVTVKAGYCRTRKNVGMKLPKLLTAEPRDVAQAIMEAERNKRDVIYVLPIWRLIMLIIRLIPENIFKRLSF